MVRTQVQLTEEQAVLLRQVAADRGVSIAALMREAVDLWRTTSPRLTRDEKRRRALAIVGMIKGGPSDIAERHDDYLAEAFDHEHLR